MRSSEYRLGLALVIASALALSMAGLFTRIIEVDTGTMPVWRGVFGALGILAIACAMQGRDALRDFTKIGAPKLIFAVIVGLGAEGDLFGDLLAFGMTLSLAVMMVISRRHRGIRVMPAACLSALMSAAIAVPFADNLAVSLPDLVWLATFGLVNSAVGLALFTLGARLLAAIETALIGAIETPLAPAWVWLIFAEVPSGATLIGGGVVLAAVLGHILHQNRIS